MLSSLLTEKPSCGFSTSLALAVTKWQLWLGSKESFLAYFLAGGFSNAINAARCRSSPYPVPAEVTQLIIICKSLLETQQLLLRQNRQRLGSPHCSKAARCNSQAIVMAMSIRVFNASQIPRLTNVTAIHPEALFG